MVFPTVYGTTTLPLLIWIGNAESPPTHQIQ